MLRRWLPWLAVVSVGSACGTDVDVNVPPAIAVSKPVLDIDARIGVPPQPGVVHIVNGTVGTLEGLTASIEYASGESGWLSASFDRTTATSDQPATLTFTPTVDNLSLGEHTSIVRVSANGAGNGPIRIQVDVIVRSRPPAKIVIVTEPSATATNGTPLGTVPVVQLLNSLDELALEPGVVVTPPVRNRWNPGRLHGAGVHVREAGRWLRHSDPPRIDVRQDARLARRENRGARAERCARWTLVDVGFEVW